MKKKSGLRVVLWFFKPNVHIPRSELRVGGESQLPQPRLGCLTLDSQLRGHRAAWKQLQKVSGLEGEFLDAKMCKYQARSVGGKRLGMKVESFMRLRCLGDFRTLDLVRDS